MTNFGTVFRGEGRYAGAEVLYTEVVQAQSRISGEDHPSTLAAIENLGILYRVQGKYQQAEALRA